MVTDDPDIKPYLENPGSDKTKEMSVKTEVTIPKDEAEPTNEVSIIIIIHILL